MISSAVSIFFTKNHSLTNRYLPSFLPPNVLSNTIKKFPNSLSYSCSKGGLFGIVQNNNYPKKRICEDEISKCHEYTAREIYEQQKENDIGNHSIIFYTKAQGNDAYITEAYPDDMINLDFKGNFPIGDSVITIHAPGQCLGVGQITNRNVRENKAIELITKVANSLSIDNQ